MVGQSQALAAVTAALRASALGLTLGWPGSSATAQPRAVLLFVGPTGTGKTEFAKAVAESVYSMRRRNRIDFNTYRSAHDVYRRRWSSRLGPATRRNFAAR